MPDHAGPSFGGWSGSLRFKRACIIWSSAGPAGPFFPTHLVPPHLPPPPATPPGGCLDPLFFPPPEIEKEVRQVRQTGVCFKRACILSRRTTLGGDGPAWSGRQGFVWSGRAFYRAGPSLVSSGRAFWRTGLSPEAAAATVRQTRQHRRSAGAFPRHGQTRASAARQEVPRRWKASPYVYALLTIEKVLLTMIRPY